MANDNVVLRFGDVAFSHGEHHVILDDASFSVRNGAKVALMGQNGAGKTTLFKLITGELKPKSGGVFTTPKEATIGVAKQVIAPEQKELTVREFFASHFSDVPYNLDKRIATVLDAVNLKTDLTKKIKAHSGGQLARLLLAYALIHDPDILLLDEPTNNLDQEGIEHLTGFLMLYEKTVLVISHDAEFLNAFTDAVLYLDVHTHTVEQYAGNYYNVVAEIAERVEREKMQNARAEMQIRKKKEQAEVFAHKGGKLRSVAKRMREAAEEAADNMVEVRREDKTIRDFSIPVQEFPFDFNGKILDITQVGIMKAGEHVSKDLELTLRKGSRVLLAGPNGIGKSTLLQRIAGNTAEGVVVGSNVRIGYYSQDFSTLDYGQTAYACLEEVMEKKDEHVLRATAAGFLLDGKVLASQVSLLSEGQKGLLVFARLTLLRPGLLILDEPTNHINFRHLSVIAAAIDQFPGAVLMVSHIPEFVSQIRIDTTIDLAKL